MEKKVNKMKDHLKELIRKNKDQINQMARNNTLTNKHGLTVSPKDDPYRNEIATGKMVTA
ncbi:hypothetical protein [Brevibacillus sp. AY1]|uniref:hypothetical protein n=1 Tax=Brevibacillus sp. AY1 TaxID=2807621 RepID=UPI002458B2B9|nr:hypothetical protein [Brevibacillus sp. AY1]MDH4620024.1 hypothetical protein [Brevibacillus sp. AY1]